MRNACQNSSVNVNCKFNVLFDSLSLCVVCCSFRTFAPLFTCMFRVRQEREAKAFTFFPVLMLFLARIFEQTHQINAIPGLISLNGIDILKALRLNGNGRLGHQCIVRVSLCVCNVCAIIIIDTFCVGKRSHTEPYCLISRSTPFLIPLLMVGFEGVMKLRSST